MNFTLLYGTETGNTEMVAEELTEELAGTATIAATDLSTFSIDDLTASDRYLILTSTYDEGGFPPGTKEFYAALEESRPDLSGLHYGLFGFGDSTYEHYCTASDALDELLQELGAIRVGEYARHDASGFEDPIASAVEWAELTVPLFAE